MTPNCRDSYAGQLVGVHKRLQQSEDSGVEPVQFLPGVPGHIRSAVFFYTRGSFIIKKGNVFISRSCCALQMVVLYLLCELFYTPKELIIPQRVVYTKFL